MWLVIFPEGTRYNVNNTAVIEKSQEFASEKGEMLLHLAIAFESMRPTKTDFATAIFNSKFVEI